MPFDEPSAKMSLANLSTGEVLVMQYNPTELGEVIEVTYNKRQVLGLSHRVLQYANTENEAVSIQLSFDALSQTGTPRYDLAAARRFLSALCYPRRGASDVRAGAPPRALFVWPEFYSLESAITRLSFKYSRFAKSGRPTLFTVDVSIEEIRDTRLYSEDVAATGTIRSGAGVGDPSQGDT